MFSRSLAGTDVPADQQSVVPSVRGLPWWGAVLLAATIAAIGAAISIDSPTPLGRVFKISVLVGSILAALAVRRRALFTAAVQPPLIAFLVGLAALYLKFGSEVTDTKTVVIRVVLPIAYTFPWMLLALGLAVAIALIRLFFTGPESSRLFGGINGVKNRFRGKAAKAKPPVAGPTSERRAEEHSARRPATNRAPRDGAPAQQRQRVPRERAAGQEPAARPTRANGERPPRRPRPDAGSPKPAARPAESGAAQPRTAGPKKAQRTPGQPATTQQPQSDAQPRRRQPSERAQPQRIPPRPRRTAGQQLRERGDVEDLAANLDD